MTIRLVSTALALLPLVLCVDGLLSGWVAPPVGRPLSRQQHPVGYWSLLVFTAFLSLVLLGVTWL